MKRHKYSDLLLYKDKIESIYSKFGIGFNQTNRIAQYFNYLNDIEEYRISNTRLLDELIKKDKFKYYFSQYYLLEICSIIDAIESSLQDEKILKNKLFDLAKGTYLLSEESSKNTKARDTSFELSLFSFLHKKGLNVRLYDPNPDIRLITSKFTYDIECKRPFSYKSLEKHIREAKRQLEKSAEIDVVPTIAISLEQVLFGNAPGIDLILSFKDSDSALSSMDKKLYEFLRTNNSLLGKILGKKQYLVLYYISCLSELKNEGMMANVTFITGNVFNYDNVLANSIVEDLNNAVYSLK